MSNQEIVILSKTHRKPHISNTSKHQKLDINTSIMYSLGMRTTLTLDDDVAAMLRKLQEENRKPFKDIVNDVLRLGLMRKESRQVEHPEYSTPEVEAGPCRYPDLDNISDILSVAEREDYS